MCVAERGLAHRRAHAPSPCSSDMNSQSEVVVMGRFSDSEVGKEKERSSKEAFRDDIIKLLQIDPKDVDHLSDEQREIFFKIRDAASEAHARVYCENYDLLARYIPLWRNKAEALKRGADIILDTIKEDCESIQSNREYLQTVDRNDENLHVKDLEDLEEDLRYRESTDLNSTYLLLAGFALENVLKGFCLLKHPDLIDREKFDRRLKTHNLPWIAEKLHLELAEAESQLLDRLRQAIIWGGRYPIPLDPEEYGRCTKKSMMTSAYSMCYPGAFTLGDTPVVFNELYEELHFDLLVEWAKKVTSRGYDQRTLDFIRDVLSAQKHSLD